MFLLIASTSSPRKQLATKAARKSAPGTGGIKKHRRWRNQVCINYDRKQKYICFNLFVTIFVVYTCHVVV